MHHARGDRYIVSFFIYRHALSNRRIEHLRTIPGNGCVNRACHAYHVLEYAIHRLIVHALPY